MPTFILSVCVYVYVFVGCVWPNDLWLTEYGAENYFLLFNNCYLSNDAANMKEGKICIDTELHTNEAFSKEETQNCM